MKSRKRVALDVVAVVLATAVVGALLGWGGGLLYDLGGTF